MKAKLHNDLRLNPPPIKKRKDIIMSELELKIEKLIKDYEAQQQVKVEPEVMVKLADILQILDDEEYAVSVHSNDTIDDKISESIANTAIIDFKKQLKQELLSKFSE